MPLFIAFLYHSTLMCGIDGGLRLNDPEIEKCGSLMCGRLQLKLKIPFSLSTIPLTKFQTPLNIFVNVVFMPFSAFEAAVFAAFSPVEIPVFIALITVVTVVLIPFQAVEAVVLIALNAVELFVFIVSQA